MKAYQVFSGDFDKDGRQYYELVATYLSKELALEKCKEVISVPVLTDKTIVESDWYNIGRVKDWDVRIRWDNLTVCRITEINIIE